MNMSSHENNPHLGEDFFGRQQELQNMVLQNMVVVHHPKATAKHQPHALMRFTLDPKFVTKSPRAREGRHGDVGEGDLDYGPSLGFYHPPPQEPSPTFGKSPTAGCPHLGFHPG